MSECEWVCIFRAKGTHTNLCLLASNKFSKHWVLIMTLMRLMLCMRLLIDCLNADISVIHDCCHWWPLFGVHYILGREQLAVCVNATIWKIRSAYMYCLTSSVLRISFSSLRFWELHMERFVPHRKEKKRDWYVFSATQSRLNPAAWSRHCALFWIRSFDLSLLDLHISLYRRSRA